jgi:thioredoxin 1
MDQLATEYTGQARVFKLDLDQNKNIAQRFKIKSIPAVMFFLKGELVETIVGVKPYAEFSSVAKRFLS